MGGCWKFMRRPQVRGLVLALPEEIHIQLHKFFSQADPAILRMYNEIPKLSSLSPIHQQQKTDHLSIVFADPHAVEGRIVLFIEFVQTSCDIAFEWDTILKLFAVQLSVQVDDITDVAGPEFGTDGDIFQCH